MKLYERPAKMEISENELWILSYYRESELAGALIMGRLARDTDDDDLRVHLTEHCAEEAHHAWLWTRTILEVGGTPRRVSETYQSRYYAEIGSPKSVLEVLALTQVFEKRVLSHFKAHLRQPETHPVVAATLEQMISDEAGHIGWVKRRLDRCARERDEGAVRATLRWFATIDQRVYTDLLEYRDRFAERVDPARANGRPTWSDSDANQRVMEVVSQSLKCRKEELDPRASLGELGVDSLDLVVVVQALEEAFRIEISAEDTEDLHTLEDLIGKVTQLAGPPALSLTGYSSSADRTSR
jgi:acyl carrier protein